MGGGDLIDPCYPWWYRIWCHEDFRVVEREEDIGGIG